MHSKGVHTIYLEGHLRGAEDMLPRLNETKTETPSTYYLGCKKDVKVTPSATKSVIREFGKNDIIGAAS